MNLPPLIDIRTMVRRHGRLIIGAVFIFCALCLYGWHQGAAELTARVLGLEPQGILRYHSGSSDFSSPSHSAPSYGDENDDSSKISSAGSISDTTDDNFAGELQQPVRYALRSRPLRDPFLAKPGKSSETSKTGEADGTDKTGEADRTSRTDRTNKKGETDEQGWRLTGIVRGQVQVAIIAHGGREEPYTSGQGPDGAVVTAIDTDRVWLQKGEKRICLLLEG